MKKLLIFLLLVVIGFAVYKFYKDQKSVSPPKTGYTVTINGHVYAVTLADDDSERSRGLSGRTSLPADQGLLFLFPAKDRYAFWMKDMFFPIDIIWIDEETVVDISENVPIPVTATYLPRYQPEVPVNKVLEINNGEAKKNNFTVGQKVIFSGI